MKCTTCTNCTHCDHLDPVLDHAPKQLSEEKAARMAGIFEEIEREDRKRATKRCLHLLESYLGAGGRDAFLKTSQPEMDYKTGLELINDDPSALLDLVEAKFAERGIN